MTDTIRHRDGGGWEEAAGYSRAVRRGNVIAVSGTTAHGPDGAALHPGDTYAQTVDCLQRGLRAVEALGGSAADVIRTRLLLGAGAQWEDAGRAHRDVLGPIAPANSTYHVELIGDDFLVEVEIDAVTA